MTAQHIVDLSLTVAEELPCSWDTHMPYQHKTFTYFGTIPDQDAPLLARTGGGAYQTRWMLLDEHTGTHLDAPAHFIPHDGSGFEHEAPAGRITVEQVPLDQLTGPAVVIDATTIPPAVPGTSPGIDVDLIRAQENTYGALTAGQILLFRGDWDRHYQPGEPGLYYSYHPLISKQHPGWPAPTLAAISYLLERGIRCNGTDAPSMGACENGAPVHLAALGTGAVLVEGLAYLNKLPTIGAWFIFAPVKIARGTGAPGRAFAILPGNTQDAR